MGVSILFRGLTAIVFAAASATAQALDVDEPNDTAVEATVAGPVGFVRPARVLRPAVDVYSPDDPSVVVDVIPADADWYRFSVLRAGSPVTVDVAFDRSVFSTNLSLEVQSLAGAPLATGSFDGAAGAYRAVTAPLAVGDYLVRVRHESGAPLLDYSIRTSRDNDDDERNDVSLDATALGTVGFVRTDRVLNFDDEDWYRLDLAVASDPVTIDVAYNTFAYDALATLEVQTLSGDVIATGSLANASGPIRALTGPLGAGAYLVRVRHDGGEAISDYAVQAYTALTMSAPSYTETSSGATLDVPVDIRGGIRPYKLGVDSRFVAPPGLVFDGVTGRVTGVPALAGRYDFMLTCSDAGSPANTVSVLTTLVVNAALDVRLGEFTAFAAGRAASRAMPSAGGTAPFAIATTLGALPRGVSFVDGGLAFSGSAEGSPDDATSGPLSIKVTDFVGLTDSVATTCVVCRPLGSFRLAEGPAASGVYVDAVEGSVLSINVTTVKRQAKRPLRLVLLRTDGTTPLAATTRAGNGAGSISRFEVPVTGRYYLVVAGASGPATELSASAKFALPKSGAGHADGFKAQDRFDVTVGALLGAVLSFSAKPDKSGLELRVQALIDPTGVQVALDPDDVTMKAGSVRFSKTLNLGGTWTIIVAGSRGGPGKMSYAYTLKQPKAGAYSADQ